MAKRKPPIPARPEPQPVLRAWHVVTKGGADVTVTAHECDVYNDALAFNRHEDQPGNHTSVLVRAFSAGAWSDVELVDTPADDASPNT